MAESQNWQLYGPFDLGMHDFMEEEFEFDFREEEEEFWREFPAVVPLDHTFSTQPGKTCIIHTSLYIQMSLEMTNVKQIMLVLQEAQGVQNKGTMRYQCYNLMMRQWRHLLTSKKNKNNKRKTESDLKTWYSWCAKHGETRELNDIPPTELDRLLGHFFVTVRRKDGSLYEPDTLSSFQRSIDRHLTKDLHKPYSIIRDTQFAPSREKLKASRKFLKGKGKGNKPNAAEPVDVAEVEQMWQHGALGASDPVTLQQTIWWLISTQMGTRGRDEHHKFKFGDFELKKASDGTEFIEFSRERGTKTRTGETEKSTNADARVFKPKMWATPDRPERCPVRIFQQYVDRRPPEMCQEDSPFYLSINHKHKPGSYWYKKLPLGIHKVDGMMKNLAKDGSLTGKKTNHSARKTQVQTLCC